MQRCSGAEGRKVPGLLRSRVAAEGEESHRINLVDKPERRLFGN